MKRSPIGALAENQALQAEQLLGQEVHGFSSNLNRIVFANVFHSIASK
jgi:hypothetical protein